MHLARRVPANEANALVTQIHSLTSGQEGVYLTPSIQHLTHPSLSATNHHNLDISKTEAAPRPHTQER